MRIFTSAVGAGVQFVAKLRLGIPHGDATRRVVGAAPDALLYCSIYCESLCWVLCFRVRPVGPEAGFEVEGCLRRGKLKSVAVTEPLLYFLELYFLQLLHFRERILLQYAWGIRRIAPRYEHYPASHCLSQQTKHTLKH